MRPNSEMSIWQSRHRSQTGSFSRAISVPLATVTKGQQRSLVSTPMSRSAPVTAEIPTLPKLVAQVRFR